MRAPVKAHIGTVADTRVIGPITQTDIVRFAGAGGDFNPLHHDPEFVANIRGPWMVIAMGQMQADPGRLASDTFGVEHVRSFGSRSACRPVRDTLTVGGTITAITDTDGETRADLDLVVSGSKRDRLSPVRQRSSSPGA